jgi:hypothetical protein
VSKRLIALPVIVVALACISSVPATATAPAPRANTEALVVLRGFGYGGDGKRALRALEPAVATEGMDLHVPDYITRSGLDDSRKKLHRYFQDQLSCYERVHVFSFIAGAWTLNPLVAAGDATRIATVIYDRSPLQERAPRIADERLHFFTWVRYGSPVFDLARTPYPSLTESGIKFGLVIETAPTSFIRKREKVARSYGEFRFECDSLGQRHDDCLYVDLNHDDLYKHFSELWPEVLAFIRTGRFSSAADRTPPLGDPFTKRVRE